MKSIKLHTGFQIGLLCSQAIQVKVKKPTPIAQRQVQTLQQGN